MPRRDNTDRPRRRRKRGHIAGMPVWVFALVVTGIVLVGGVGAVVAVRAAGRGAERGSNDTPQAGRPKAGPLPDETGAYDQGELTRYLTGRFEPDVLAVLGQPNKPGANINNIRMLEFGCAARDPGTGKRTNRVIVILEDAKVKYLKFED